MDRMKASHWWFGDSKVLYFELHPQTHVQELLGTHTSVLLFFFRCLFRCFSLPVFFSYSYWFYGILLIIKPSFCYTRNQRSCHNLDNGVCVEKEEILGAVLPYIYTSICFFLRLAWEWLTISAIWLLISKQSRRGHGHC